MISLVKHFLSAEHSYPTRLFSVTYRALGAYIFFYTLITIPSGILLYSQNGLLPDATLNNTPLFSSIFLFFDSPSFILAGLTLLSLLGGIMFLGVRSAFLPFLAWILYISFQNRNVFTGHPATDVVGYMLLLQTLILLHVYLFPINQTNRSLKIPKILYDGSWATLGLAFTASGIDRLRGEAWFAGTGFKDFLNIIPQATNPLSSLLYQLLYSFPSPVIYVLTWLITLTFILALPLSLWHEKRTILLALLYLFFGGVFLISELRQIVLGLFIFFLFLSDIYYPYAQALATRHTSIMRSAIGAYIRRVFSL